MKELIENVVQWGVDRGLDKVGHLAQAKYTLKETAELLDAYADSDVEKMNDAIGDILVTLIVGASNYTPHLKQLEIYMMGNADYATSDNPRKFLQQGRFMVGTVLYLIDRCEKNLVTYSEYNECLNGLICCLAGINNDFNQRLSLKDCLQLAYDEIKNRKGKLINGQFIKD